MVRGRLSAALCGSGLQPAAVTSKHICAWFTVRGPHDSGTHTQPTAQSRLPFVLLRRPNCDSLKLLISSCVFIFGLCDCRFTRHTIDS